MNWRIVVNFFTWKSNPFAVTGNVHNMPRPALLSSTCLVEDSDEKATCNFMAGRQDILKEAILYLHSGEELSNCVEVAQDVHVHLNYFYEQNEVGVGGLKNIFRQSITILSQLE